MRIPARTGVRSIPVLAVSALVAVGCGGGQGGGGSSDLSGAVTADGSSTVFPIAQALAEEFRAEHGEVEVSVGTSGTGGGFEKFCKGETDLSTASRPIKDEERMACTEGKVEFVELGVATDGISVVVNPENDFVDCLTLAQLEQVWAPGSTVETWKDLDASFPDEKIALYGPGTDSGTFDYFTEQVNGEEGASRSDYTASEDDNVLVQGVAGDEGALGYFGHGYVEENEDKVRAVEVDGGEGCVAPTTETITEGAYAPLARPLYFYVSEEGASKEQVATFVDFALENATTLAGDVGLVAPAQDVLEASTTSWDEFRGEREAS